MSGNKISITAENIRQHNSKVYFTIDQLMQLPEWPSSPLIELVNGEIFMPPSPNIYHHDISARLVTKFRKLIDQEGRVFNAPVDVVLSPEDVVIPDIFIVDKSNSSIIGENNIQGVPDLIVEILSKNREHDLVVKKNLYEAFGVGEYWIIDPEEKQINQYHKMLIDGSPRLGLVSSYELHEIITSELYPLLQIDCSEIF